MTSRPVRRLPASKEMLGSWHNLPSRSENHEAFGLPMISLTSSSSSSASMGRRNGRINSKLIAETSQHGSPAVSRASESERQWLMRPFPLGALHRAPVLRKRPFQRDRASGSK